jgi:pimeloyl-ACP methyl ester carboxylesterase
MLFEPSFLQFLYRPNTAHLPYKDAIFKHKAPIGPVHAQWWTCKQVDAVNPEVVLLFIPGNPGLVSFYSLFLSAIHKSSYTRLAILSHAHVGHTPGVGDGEMDARRYCLTTQIQNAVEAFDAIKSMYGPEIKIVLLGHSVGSWIALQVSIPAGYKNCSR